jgi:hypothetical protein
MGSQRTKYVVVHDGETRHVRKVAAQERERSRFRHSLHLVQALECLLIHQIATESVRCVRRVCDDLTSLQGVDGATDLSRFWRVCVYFDDHEAYRPTSPVSG